jgi:hypothetical protein
VDIIHLDRISEFTGSAAPESHLVNPVQKQARQTTGESHLVNLVPSWGSKKTHAKRVSRLQAAGFSAAEIERISAPIGVDIQAQIHREIALIMAELIQVKNQYR